MRVQGEGAWLSHTQGKHPASMTNDRAWGGGEHGGLEEALN